MRTSLSFALCVIPILCAGAQGQDLDGRELSIEAFKGKGVLLNF